MLGGRILFIGIGEVESGFVDVGEKRDCGGIWLEEGNGLFGTEGGVAEGVVVVDDGPPGYEGD